MFKKEIRDFPLPSQERFADELIPFREFIMSLDKEILAKELQDGLWKNQIQETELYRKFILLYYKNCDLIYYEKS